jgi:hypothetical protein
VHHEKLVGDRQIVDVSVTVLVGRGVTQQLRVPEFGPLTGFVFE